MAEPAIAKVWSAEGSLTTELIGDIVRLRAAAGRGLRTHGDYAEVLSEATLAAWTDGLELGLSLATRDIVPARKLLAWIRAEISGNDAQALAGVDQSVARFLEVLER